MDEPADMYLTTQERIARAISNLPTLKRAQIPVDDSCPICLISFSSIHEKSERRQTELVGLTAEPINLGGVTKLERCGHVFCREDLIEWIRGRHGTCPACRHIFLNVRPITDSDNESSDGDYIPGEEDDEDEDEGFLDTDGFTDMDVEDEFDVDEMGMEITDGLTDTDVEHEFDVDETGMKITDGFTDMDVEDEFDVDEMGMEIQFESQSSMGMWDDEAEFEDADENMENWGLSDGDGSESLSDGDLFVNPEDNELQEDGADVYDDETYLSAHEDDGVEESK